MDKSTRITDEIYLQTETPPQEDGQTTQFLDVHIYNVPTEQEEPPSVESELAPEPAANEPEQEHTEPGQLPRPNKRRTTILVCICVLCILLLIGGGVLYVLPLLTMSATVTVIPVTRQISTTDTITVITGQKATGQQIPGSLLPSVTMSQQQTTVTTGKGHQNAQPGHGLVTFYNSAPSEQVITLGTLLTGSDGIQIVTDRDAYIPPAQYPTFGQATVPAHAAITGSMGNMKAGDIYGPCNCHLNISAVNDAFTGGQEARDYQAVTQADIDNTASSIKSSLDKSVQAALKAQVQSDQTLVTPVSCQQSITTNHQPGTEATQVQVIVSETCTGATYNTQAYQDRLLQNISQEATRQLGEGYTQNGAIESSIVQTSSKAHDIITLQVKSSASYSYQFTLQQQQALKNLIAGKSKAQAITLLLHTPGVQSVSLSLTHGQQLPTDTGRIQVTFLLMM